MISQAQAEPALAQLDEAERLFSDQATGDDLGMLKRERARALAILGRADESVVLAREAIELFDRRNEPELGAGYAALGEGLGLSGEYDAADDAFRQSVDLLEDQCRWREAVQSAQAWGKMLRRAGRESALDARARRRWIALQPVRVDRALTTQLAVRPAGPFSLRFPRGAHLTRRARSATAC